MASERIAIVGSVSCGKTVLLSVLTHKFQNRTEDGFQIRPFNQEAVTFCTEKWADLEQGIWPAPTPPATEPPIYKWEICHGKKTKEIITSDIAGEAWSSFITSQVESAEEKDTTSILETIKKQWDSLPQKMSPQALQTHITTVENMLNGASGIILLLDLKQIINKDQGYQQAMYLPTALVQYMKHIHRQHIPITLVLSKTDEYKYEYDKLGSWEKVVSKYVSWIPQFQCIIPVSAVANTRNNLPAPDFDSEGLEDLCNNIWGIMSSAKSKERKRSILRFGYIDLPILLGLYVFYLLLVIVSPFAFICKAFFWLAIVGYCLVKLYLYTIKHK